MDIFLQSSRFDEFSGKWELEPEGGPIMHSHGWPDCRRDAGLRADSHAPAESWGLMPPTWERVRRECWKLSTPPQADTSAPQGRESCGALPPSWPRTRIRERPGRAATKADSVAWAGEPAARQAVLEVKTAHGTWYMGLCVWDVNRHKETKTAMAFVGGMQTACVGPMCPVSSPGWRSATGSTGIKISGPHFSRGVLSSTCCVHGYKERVLPGSRNRGNAPALSSHRGSLLWCGPLQPSHWPDPPGPGRSLQGKPCLFTGTMPYSLVGNHPRNSGRRELSVDIIHASHRITTSAFRHLDRFGISHLRLENLPCCRESRTNPSLDV
ncbi:uncharacterized protein LOC125083916 [Lutra lutra]|uniref:uncharacterized protein LOC125083916 n=1 Tax=Lutra lutra TaxID=9657 RepID=UPI001FD43BBF|nr:uncharacterized protein LOC125083916 [Lutra lutra]